MQRAEGFGQSPPYVMQGGPSVGDKGPGDRDDGLQGHRTSKQHYSGRESRRPPSSLMKYWHDFKHRGIFFTGVGTGDTNAASRALKSMMPGIQELKICSAKPETVIKTSSYSCIFLDLKASCSPTAPVLLSGKLLGIIWRKPISHPAPLKISYPQYTNRDLPQCNGRIYPSCFRITKVNCIKVKGSPWAQTTTGCYSVRGCNVCWVFLCLTKSWAFLGEWCLLSFWVHN